MGDGLLVCLLLDAREGRPHLGRYLVDVFELLFVQVLAQSAPREPLLRYPKEQCRESTVIAACRAEQPRDVGRDLVSNGRDVVGHGSAAHHVRALVMQADLA